MTPRGDVGENRRGCDAFRELLADEAMGQLAPRAAAGLEEHLARCAACRERAGEVDAVLRALDAAPTVEPSPAFDAALRARLAEERPRERAGGVAVFAALAAAFRGLRRFQLAAAVYPLVFLALAYVLWTVTTRETPPRPGPVTEGSGGIVFRAAPGTPERRKRLMDIRDMARRKLADMREDVFAPEGIDLEPVSLDRYPPLAELVAYPEGTVEPPQTVADLARLPDTAPFRRVLPAGPPGGSVLARTRLMAAKNAPPHVRVALARGVAWLCRAQRRTGSWTARDAGAPRSVEYSDVEVTAAAALALMESGFAPQGRARPSMHLRGALRRLVRMKRPDGTFLAAGPRRWHAQAMVCTALSEAIRLSDRESVRARFRPIVGQALAALRGEQTDSGAWEGDPELTALAVLASEAARGAGLGVDAAAHGTALAWLRARRRDPGPDYASVEPGPGTTGDPSYAAIGEIIASGRLPAEGLDALPGQTLRVAPVVWESGDCLRWYVGTLAAYRLDGTLWQRWQEGLTLNVVARQNGWSAGAEPSLQGSWEAHGVARSGGRAYATAMGVLTLSASLGHSPVGGAAR